ncbi:MAG: hypothetical protein WDO19_26435 [Bacteroidota bacterium]
MIKKQLTRIADSPGSRDKSYSRQAGPFNLISHLNTSLWPLKQQEN